MPTTQHSHSNGQADEWWPTAGPATRAATQDSLELGWLAAVEHDLRAALDTARASVALCEQALRALSEARQRTMLTPDALGTYDTDGLCRYPTATGDDEHADYLPRSAPQASQLTAREAQILGLVAAGHSNRMVAETLFLSPRTIERHIANLYRKIHVHNRAEAANYA